MINQLLPEGFRDSLPDLANEEYKINDAFLKILIKSGFYLLVLLLLNLKALFLLSNESQKSESFRILDPLSQKVMAIRSDITSQIARISCGSLSKYERPLKLCYSGEVLKVKNKNLSMSRQSTQIGAEVVGITEETVIVEIINFIVKILKKLKFKNFILNFSMPNLIKLIVKDFKLSKKDYQKLIDSFKNKNLENIKNYPEKILDMSNYLLSCIGNIDKNLNRLKNMGLKKQIKEEIETLLS